jgi:hypothetical protein
MALTICLCLATAAASQEQLPNILPINPVPDLELVKYDVFGYLDEIRDDAVIIDDSQHPWSAGEKVRFFVEGSSRPVERSLFKVGDLVGCVYDDLGAVKELWKLKAPPVNVR